MAEGGPGASGDVVAALRAVDGVADASITPDRRIGGAGTLHLTLMPGADEVAVATAVNRILREHFGLAVDTDNVSVVDETAPVRLTAVPALVDEPADAESERGSEPEPEPEPEPEVQAEPDLDWEPEPYVDAPLDEPVPATAPEPDEADAGESESVDDDPATARVLEALRPEPGRSRNQRPVALAC